MAASEKPFLSFLIDKELLDRVDTFWHKNKFPTRAEAVRWLMKAALDAKLAPKGE